MPARGDLEATFAALHRILYPYAERLVCKSDRPGELYVDTAFVMNNGKPLFFGAVLTRKRYVGYHLMPVYVHPPLLDPVSCALQARRHGKSCFNFQTIDGALIEELARLTERGFEYYREQRYV